MVLQTLEEFGLGSRWALCCAPVHAAVHNICKAGSDSCFLLQNRRTKENVGLRKTKIHTIVAVGLSFQVEKTPIG